MIFRPDSLRLGWWGGDASRNGAELFEIEADFSAKIVTFRLVGGDASPHPPSKSATGHSPRLGVHNFRLGGHKQSFGGGMAPECPPVAPGLGRLD